MLKRFEELKTSQKDEQWSAQVIFTCEHLWSALSDPELFDRTLNQATVPAFVTFLADADCFQLAQTVVPELREVEVPPTASRYQRFILDSLKSYREQSFARRTAPHDAVDTAAYRLEKDILYEAEVYRAQLFLQRSDQFTAQERQAIMAWLEQAPAALRRRGEGQ